MPDKLKTPKINPVFKSLIPPLNGDEYRQLEQNILTNGCRSAISLWRGYIIDGHNRFEICGKHGIKYNTATIRLPSLEAAKVWILEHQLGRRNLTQATRIEMSLLKAKLSEKGTYIRKAAARDAGVSERMVHQYIQIKSKGTPELLDMVMKGELKIGAAHRKLGEQVEVITTTHEEINVDGFNPPNGSPFYKEGVLGNIRLIRNHYNFFAENGLDDLHEIDEAGKITKYLEKHAGRIKKANCCLSLV